jgi:hypothetical protein
MRGDSQVSSSSERMELSLLPKDVLELGRLLVSEYLQERDGDTLSRWFLHAIAERLVEFNEAKGEKARKCAQDAAADLILRFWRHRKVTDLNVDPLSRFEELFKSLELLIPKANPWMSQRVHQTEKLAAELFECLSSLTIGLMLLGLSESGKHPRNSSLFARFLPTNEQGMLRYFEFVERSLTKKDTVTAAEAVSLESRTVIETVQAWTALTRTKLDQLDRILSDAIGKLPKSADSFKKRDSKKTPRKAPAKKEAKKNSPRI